MPPPFWLKVLKSHLTNGLNGFYLTCKQFNSYPGSRDMMSVEDHHMCIPNEHLFIVS